MTQTHASKHYRNHGQLICVQITLKLTRLEFSVESRSSLHDGGAIAVHFDIIAPLVQT